MQVGLNHLRFAGRFGISLRYFHGRPQIHGPHFGAILRRIVSKTSIAAAGIQDFLALEKPGRVRLHVFEKASTPFVVHFRESGPLEAKAQRGLQLSLVCSGGGTVSQKRLTER